MATKPGSLYHMTPMLSLCGMQHSYFWRFSGDEKYYGINDVAHSS